MRGGGDSESLIVLIQTAWGLVMTYFHRSCAALALALSTSSPALSREVYFCTNNSQYIGNGHCSDGSIAVYKGWVPDDPQPQQEPRKQQQVVPRPSGLMGAWSTNVTGAVWTSPSHFPGWATLHVSPGAMAGLLVIYPNGRYVWNAWGGKRGTWRASGDAEYPILLNDAAERRVWRVGFNTRDPSAIYIVDTGGFFWYSGKRP